MLPSCRGHSRWLGLALACSLIVALHAPAFGDSPKKKRDAKGKVIAGPTPTPGDSLTNIPLPIGHEAKGLILPNFDPSGHLTGKLEAGTARRIDEENIQFSALKLTTYTEENTTDLLIDMSSSILNLKTRVISSKERTTVKRSDFDIVGDSMQFDTVSRKGTLVGHVKMVLVGKSALGTPAEKDDE